MEGLRRLKILVSIINLVTDIYESSTSLIQAKSGNCYTIMVIKLEFKFVKH
jgi:hypothetical protein